MPLRYKLYGVSHLTPATMARRRATPDVVIRSKSTTHTASHHTHYGWAVKGVAPRIRARSSCLKSACAGAVQRCDGLTGSMARYARISDVLACSDYVSASTSPHLAGDDRLRGRRRSRPRERAPAMDRDGWCRRLLVARTRHDHRERPNGPRAARACRSAASATPRSTRGA